MARDTQFYSRSFFADQIGMCLAIPGKIIKIHSDYKAIASFNGIEKEINISFANVNIGDYVIVHAGFAIEKVKRNQADQIHNLIRNG